MPSRTSSPRTTGSRAVVAHDTMSASASALARSATASAGRPCDCERRGGPLRGGERSSPDADPLDRPHRAMRSGHVRRKRARADDDEMPGVGARQVRRGEGRSRAGPAQRQRFAIDQRERVAGRAVHQHVERRDARKAALAIAREHGDDLDAQADPVPRGHQQQPIAFRRDRMARAHRCGRAGHELLSQRLDERTVVERGVHVGGGEIAERCCIGAALDGGPLC